MGEGEYVVGVGGAELEVEAALDVGEGVAGADERREHVVHRRVVPRPTAARIRSHLSVFFGGREGSVFLLSVRLRPPVGF